MRKPKPNPKSIDTCKRWIVRELSLFRLADLLIQSVSYEDYERRVRALYEKIVKDYEQRK